MKRDGESSHFFALGSQNCPGKRFSGNFPRSQIDFFGSVCAIGRSDSQFGGFAVWRSNSEKHRFFFVSDGGNVHQPNLGQTSAQRQAAVETNRRVYDRMAASGDPLCRPASDEELARPLSVVDQAGWLGNDIRGKHVLCLAAGGGRQSSLYAAAGASVTVVDVSGAMLELDRQVAAERGYSLRVLQTSMEDLSGLEDAFFDIVIHPVSTCYVPDVRPVFKEVAPGDAGERDLYQPAQTADQFTGRIQA